MVEALFSRPGERRPLVYAHLGDLHITDAKARNYQDLLLLLAQLEVECASQLDFVYLPGDVAANGALAQHRLVAAALQRLSMPVHTISGDHDMQPSSLANFYALPAAPLPKAVEVRGVRVRCLFLDVCGPGTGGPDFRLGPAQLAWLREQLSQLPVGTESALFLHTYPADLRDPAERQELTALLAQYRVALADMGHTHYNELANDGTTIFAATRSTGQLEEGPVGYSLISLDQGIVSWRFKPLDGFLFVLITAPADYRLLRHAGQAVGPPFIVRAVVFGANALASAAYWLGDDGPRLPMQRDVQGVWWALATPLAGASPRLPLTVEARDATGRPGRHQLLLALAPYQAPPRLGAGGDANSIGAWEENGILGTQLGPNRNARPAHSSS